MAVNYKVGGGGALIAYRQSLAGRTVFMRIPELIVRAVSRIAHGVVFP